MAERLFYHALRGDVRIMSIDENRNKKMI